KKLVSLAEYVSRMKEEQKTIYYACGDSIKNIDKLPQIESIKEKEYEILYLTDEVDDFVMNGLREFDGKEIKSVNSDDIIDETEKKEAEEKTKENQDLLTFVKESLDGKIKEAVISQKLKTHPVCLSSDGVMSLEMEKYFNKMNSEGGVAGNHILEINSSHKMFKTLTETFENDKEKAKKLCNILYNQAMLIAGFPIDDPTAYTDMIFDLLA
ncbi:MAG: molecular chaperone HtpG, partial [Oscillospiraceae bacterium]